MAEEYLANKDQPPSDTPGADYDRIFATLAETETGRRFLEEYARRVRPIEIEASLAAIERMQSVIRAGGASERLRLLNEIVEMAEAITRVRAEIMAIRPPGGTLETTEVLGSIVRMTEEATSSILAATEQMQEVTFALRAHGADSSLCDRLDALATETFTACTFQDLTGQRTRKVIDALQDLEGRINTIIGASDGAAEIAALETADLAQADVDAMLAPEPPEEERQEASLEDISQFMRALEPLMVPHQGSSGAPRASEPPPAPATSDDVRPELSVADAVVAETVEVRAITDWGVDPAAATPPQPVVQEAAAEWVVNDASPLPEAEPDWMILRRLEMELDAQAEAEEANAGAQARQTPHDLLPPAELNAPASAQPSVQFNEPQAQPENETVTPAETASSPQATKDTDDFLFDPHAPAWEPSAGTPAPDATTTRPDPGSEDERGALPDATLSKPQKAEASGNESARPRASYDPLAPIRAMSDEQKIALFS